METDVHSRLSDLTERLGRGVPDDDRGRVLLAVAVGWLLTLGARFLVPALLPQVKRTFDIDNATAGFAITLIWACYALMQFPAGVLIDRVGERVLLTVSLVVAAGSLGVLGATPLFAGFIIGCIALGLGTGLYGPPRGTLISKTFAPNAGTAFGVTLAAGSVGSAALPLIGGTFADAVGWQPLLAATAVPFVLTGAFVHRVVPDVAKATPSAGEAGAVRERLGTALRRRAVIVPVVAVGLMLFAFQGLTAFLPTYLILAKGLSQATASALFAAMFVSAAACQLVAGSAADRFGPRPVLIATAGVGVLTLGALPFVTGLLPIAALVLALGSRLAVAPVTNDFIIETLPDEVQGTAWGLLRTLLFLFAATGSTVVGAFADLGRLNTAWFALAGVTAVATAVYALLPRHADRIRTA